MLELLLSKVLDFAPVLPRLHKMPKLHFVPPLVEDKWGNISEVKDMDMSNDI